MDVLAVKILSTHGDPHLCGLTEVEVFDEQGKKIRLAPTNLNMRNVGRVGLSQGARQLVSGTKFTTDMKNMWIGSLPPPASSQKLEISISLNPNQKVASLKLWNYNRSLAHGTKGIKTAQVWLNGQKRWHGEVRMAKGTVAEDYSEIIRLHDGALPSREKPPKDVVREQAFERRHSHSTLPSSQVSQMAGKAKPLAPNVELAKYASQVAIKAPTADQQLEDLFVKPQGSTNIPPDSNKPVWLQGGPAPARDLSYPGVFDGKIASRNKPMNRRQMEKQAEQNNAVEIEQSLETLELFKMTNLNRISQEQRAHEAPEATLTSEGITSNYQSKLSVASASRKAPRVMKSPFPDDFCQPSPSRRAKNSSIATQRTLTKKDGSIFDEESSRQATERKPAQRE
jgi:hypothetical protein